MLYIYDTVEMARSIVMTVHHFGLEAYNVGSAVVMSERTYHELTVATTAPEAIIIAKEVAQ